MPATMRSVAINSYSEPAKFELANLPVPTISSPTDVLIRVHAASINPGDLTLASGMTRLMVPVEFPYRIGHDMSGTVVQVGVGVTEVAVGDNVYTNLPIARAGSHPFLYLAYTKSQGFIRPYNLHFAKSVPGSASEYALTSSKNLALKPASLSHVEAASLPCVAITTMQAFDSANSAILGGLSGKTIFVPAGLSGTGSIALQFAKHVYRAAKVITTVSTSKMPKIRQLLGEDNVDQIIDYTKQDVLKEVEKGSVDFLYDTVGTGMAHLSLVKPKSGIIVSISNLPAGKVVARVMPQTPWILKRIFDAVDFWNRKRAGRWSVKWECRLTWVKVSDLDRISRLAEEKKIRPVVGRVAKLRDLQEIRDACTAIKSGKGGVGKFVIEID